MFLDIIMPDITPIETPITTDESIDLHSGLISENINNHHILTVTILFLMAIVIIIFTLKTLKKELTNVKKV